MSTDEIRKVFEILVLLSDRDSCHHIHLRLCACEACYGEGFTANAIALHSGCPGIVHACHMQKVVQVFVGTEVPDERPIRQKFYCLS
jgi:hypothetical protein